MQPASGVPSFTLYRGSLLALLVGVVVAVWLLVQPPGSTTDAALAPIVITPSTQAEDQSTPAATNGAGPTATTAATTPQAGTTATAGPTNTTAPGTTTTPSASGNTYTVVGGDTLGAICASQRPNVDDCVARLRTLNGLSGDDIAIGQVLTLP